MCSSKACWAVHNGLALFLLLVVAISCRATNYTVKQAGGGNYTTIDACLSGMSASGGDTCTVFAGTYTPSATFVAGTAGNYNILNVNGSDVVAVNGSITLASHTKIVGNCAALSGITHTTADCGFFFSRVASPTSTCVGFPGSQITDYWLEYSEFYACDIISEPQAQANTFGYYIGLTEAYTDTTNSSPDEGCGITTQGDHKFLEQIEFSHVGEGFRVNGHYQVIRNNSMHDTVESEVSGTHCDTHIDFDETAPGAASLATQYVLFESNKNVNRTGPNSHVFLTQVSSNTLDTIIERFNITAHNGSAGVENDQNATYVKAYNNTWVDMNNASPQSGGDTNHCRSGATNCGYFNDIFYYPEDESAGSSHTVTPIAADSTSLMTSSIHFHLAWCTSGPCDGILGYTGGVWTGDATNILADPKFVNYSSSGLGNLHLQAGSPALNAGTNLTTVAATDSGSGTSLIVNDAHFFQDGWGFPSGVGVGQMTPDCISVTTVSNKICITAVNYSTNTLTLASSITRSVGDKVWINTISDGTPVLTGTAPNIGALGGGSGAACTPTLTLMGVGRCG